ncbi:CTRB-like protein, partial [Mya arenaria]
MKMVLRVLAIALLSIGYADANICTSMYYGTCYDLFSGLNGACSAEVLELVEQPLLEIQLTKSWEEPLPSMENTRGKLGNYASQWSVGVGLQDQRSIYTTNIVSTSHIYPHERFIGGQTNINDIALVKLSKRIDISGRYARPACLPQQSDSFTNDICTVSGWGATYYDANGHAPITNQLEYVNLRTISNNECSYYLGSSHGDSGGPLVCKRNGVWEIA